jgi:hypothetical protein
MFVNEAVFLNEASANQFRINFGNGSEESDDFCPFCGRLACLEDEIEQYNDIHAVRA